MTNAELIERNGFEDVAVFENPAYDGALIGISHDNRAVYSFVKMADCLVKTYGMSLMDAEEFIEFNAIRSLPYVSNSPVVV